MGKGAQAYRPQPNSECHKLIYRSQGMRDKLHIREGNNPDRRLRSLSIYLVRKDVILQRQPGCWLRSSHHLKSA